ncbi:MAG: amidohydrolase family protein [Halioglobus sp.]
MIPNIFVRFFLTLVAFSAVALSAYAQEQPEPKRILFTNVNVFDGVNDSLQMNTNVLVEDNLIASIGPSIALPAGAELIDGGGRTLMPGLIDSHVHFYLSMDGARAGMETSRWDYFPAMGAAAAQEWFADGFTTVRDAGGMYDGLRRVIDAGLLDGPRMYLAGGMLSQSSGHGDMVPSGQSNPEHSNLVKLGITLIADGDDEVRKKVRQNFSSGANFTKIMIGGGVAGAKGPMWAAQFTDAEIIAAVEESATRDMYVSAHIYRDDHIKRALDLGVKGIEHGQYISEKTAKLLKEKGAFISPYVGSVVSDEIFNHPVFGNKSSFEYARTVEMKENAKNFVDVIKKVKPLVVFSSDIVSTNGLTARQARDFEKHVFAESFGNFETLVAMTSAGGKVAAMTGRSNPYPNKLGVIEKGAYADILLVDGNPLEDISVIGTNKEWFNAAPRERGIETIRLIMKDGKVYKNTLQ